jgi:pimeloyl-[acyl-carrier protein] synthase
MQPVSSAPAFNPFLPEFREDPYPHYHAIREQDPVHWTFLSVWLMTRYADVVTVLKDARFSADPRNWEGYARRYLRGGEPGPLARFHSKWLLGIDPPDHTRLRGLANRAFTPQAVERMRVRIQQFVDELFDRVEPAGRMDVIADLAYPLPLLVIADLLGVPRDHCDRLKTWSYDLNPSFDPLMPLDVFERVNDVVREMTEYFSDLIRRRREQPGDDLLSGLIAARDQNDRLSEEELLATVVLLFWAGHETTVNLLGNGILSLLRHPEAIEEVRANPSLATSAVEEMLRFESPVQLTYRMALQDVEWSGRTIRRGQQVVLALGAANRDPAEFPDPDRFDVARRDSRHVAFSHGIHFCLGAALARVQAQLAVRSLVARLDGLTLAAEHLEWNPNILVRGLKALPVQFRSRQGADV